MSDESELKLGDRIAIDGRLEREFERALDSYKQGKKLWKRQMLINPQFGILVGYRLLSNGRVYYGEDGPEYTGVDYFKAALVTTSLKTKPFFARLDDIKAAPAAISAAISLSDTDVAIAQSAATSRAIIRS